MPAPQRDLVLETRSPSDRPQAVAEKVDQWLALGVRLVWEINPATQTVTVYQPEKEPVAVTGVARWTARTFCPDSLFRVFG